MSQAWVLLWLPLSAPTPAQKALVEGWARHEHVSLRVAEASPPPTQKPYPSEIVAYIEGSLEAARLALDAGDTSGSAEHLVHAGKAIDSHPELPQSAWLMAEALQLDAAIARASGDDARAIDMLSEAAGLEGERAAALDRAAHVTRELAERPRTELSLIGPGPGDVVEWDGVPQSPRGELWFVTSTVGMHHVRVLRGAQLLWAGWTRIATSTTLVEVPLSPPAACSAEDLALGRSPKTIASVRCESWLAARPASGGAVEVARCHLGACKPFARWPRPAPALALSQAQKPDEKSDASSSYWGYGFLGVAVAATATALIWSATRSDDSERTVWVYEGIR